MPRTAARKLSPEQLAVIHEGLAKAGLGNFKISALHLRPRLRSTDAAAADGDGPCHSQQMPNGHWIIVCD
jgi:hypothetical protein